MAPILVLYRFVWLRALGFGALKDLGFQGWLVLFRWPWGPRVAAHGGPDMISGMRRQPLGWDLLSPTWWSRRLSQSV